MSHGDEKKPFKRYYVVAWNEDWEGYSLKAIEDELEKQRWFIKTCDCFAENQQYTLFFKE